MRRLIAAMAVLLVAALALLPWRGGGPGAAVAQDDNTQRSITVSGEAEVRVVPDEVTIVLGVETSDKELQVAKAANDAIVRRLIGVTDDFGIDRRQVQTDYLSIEPRYRDEYEQRDFIGYFVRNTVEVTLRDVPRFDEVLSGLLEAGATHVHGIDFRTTELRLHRDEARSLAIRAAKEKATAMAAELALTVGRPTSISEGYGGWWSGYGSWWGGRYNAMTQNVVTQSGTPFTGEDSTLAPGQIAITASVNVTFEVQ